MAMTYPMGTLYVNGTKVAEVANIEVVSHRQLAPSLPKPTRVEKWQRWLDSKGVEFVVAGPSDECHGNGVYPLRKEGADGKWWGNNLLGGKNWTFLGYAKPDKVEVGQRWRHRAKGTIEVAYVDTQVGILSTTSNDTYGVEMRTMEQWEYLGMAESVQGIEKAQTTTPNKSQSEFAFAPTTEHGVVKQAIVEQCEKAVKANAANVARRANEEAAKRLIANPPEWAYPKAWMCAVLAVVEDETLWPLLQGKWPPQPGQSHREPAIVSWARSFGVAPSEHIKMNADSEQAYRIVAAAYARGMERSSPMTRQGVKGGISTCDLGVDYE